MVIGWKFVQKYEDENWSEIKFCKIHPKCQYLIITNFRQNGWKTGRLNVMIIYMHELQYLKSKPPIFSVCFMKRVLIIIWRLWPLFGQK
jgi:hypothetical protein